MADERRVFQDLIEQAARAGPAVMAVAHPCQPDALLGAVDAARHGLIAPILVAPRHKLQQAAAASGVDLSPYRMVDVPHSHAAAAKAVELARTGEAHALMNGSLQTDEFLHAVLDRQTGLRTDRRLSHVFIISVASYPRYLFLTDAAINIAPDLPAKVDITQNAIDLVRALGIETPKVAILSAVETVMPAIQSTIDAAALCKMADRGQITGALLDGPLAFDSAISRQAADAKGIASAVAGAPDILVVPDLESGNMLAKQLSYLAAAASAGIVMGARVPIALTSRTEYAPNRLASAAVASLLSHRGQTGQQTPPPA